MDIKKSLSAGADIEDAIIGVPKNRKLRTDFGRKTVLDLSGRKREFEEHMFPLNQVFDSRDWFYDWRDYWRERGEDVQDLERDFDRGVIERIARYKMPLIRLDRKNSREAMTTAAKEKIAHWFWSVTLGELFGSSTETRLARDVPELVDWIRDRGPRPRALDEAVFQQERLRSLRMRISAAYKGIHALLMHHGCRDFKTNRPTDIMTFFNDQIDIHHIFPQAWCKMRASCGTWIG